jgi:hypothetical protein
MNLLSGRKPLFAGLTLILMTNAAALLGVAHNRSGTPESTLTLTQREFLPVRSGGPAGQDNSGLELSLNWRVLDEASGAVPVYDFGGPHSAPRWLDRAKLAELGFDTAAAEQRSEDAAAFARQTSREVLAVLEFDGPAYRRALELAHQRLQAEQAKAATAPADKAAEGRLKFAGEALQREENSNSRLFAVDAGLDLAALRARYQDRSRYAIARVRVYPMLLGAARERRVGGRFGALAIDRVNVPLEFAGAVQASLRGSAGPRGAAPGVEIAVAYGQRLEPWIVAVRATTDVPPRSPE